MLLIALPWRLLMVSRHGQKKVLSLIRFVPYDQIPKIKICHMFAIEHPEVIERRRQLIATHVIDSEKEVQYGSIDNGGDDLDKEYDMGLGKAGVRTGVNQSGTQEME